MVMLTIRREQMEALRGAALERFRRNALIHLYEMWPRRCAELGDDVLKPMIAATIDRAMELGFEVESDALRFLDLIFFFGDRFGETPSTAWAKPLLEDARGSPGECMDALCQRAVEASKAGGPSEPAWTPASTARPA
jgi:hypothetical protein